jgi:hypothetical protein
MFQDEQDASAMPLAATAKTLRMIAPVPIARLLAAVPPAETIRAGQKGRNRGRTLARSGLLRGEAQAARAEMARSRASLVMRVCGHLARLTLISL